MISRLIVSARVLVLGCVIAFGVLVLGAGSADAAGYENICASLGGPPLCAGGLNEPFGLAVDNSSDPETKGDVYVAGLGSVVTRFDAAGQPAEFTGVNSNISGDSLGGFTFAVGVGVDPATGAFYVTDRTAGGNVLDKFSAAGEAEGAPISLPGFTAVTGVAVDRSGGPSDGDIYVADGSATGRVDKLDSTGNVLLEIMGPGGSLAEPYSVAVDGSGNLYVANFAAGTVLKFNEKGEFQSTLNETGAQAVGIDPSNGNVFVVDASGTEVQIYSSTGVKGESFGGLGGFSAGIGISGFTHHVYVSNLLSANASVFAKAFEGPPPPAPLTGDATEVEGHTAILHGIVNREAGNKEKLDYHFAYNSTGACNGPGSKETPAGEIAEGEEPVAVETKAEGLLGKTAYKFCLVATNPGESVASKNEESFETQAASPTITAGVASAITTTSATLEAQINPGGAATACTVEYGLKALSEEVEHSEPCTAPLGEGVAAVASSVVVKGLAPATTYHYRFSATNTSEGGKQLATGAEQELKTLPLALVTSEGASGIAPEGATLNGKVTINGGENAKYYFELSGAATCESFGCPRTNEKPVTSETIIEPVTGLSPVTAYHARLVVVVEFEGHPITFSEGGEVEFTTLALASAVTGTASGVGSGSVTLNGTVTLRTTDPANYYFEYGETGAKTAPVAISGEGEHTIATTVEGLQAKTLYHYHLVVEVVGHLPLAEGATGEFTTLILTPAVSNLPAVSVGRTTATLTGEVNTEEGASEYAIQYGTTTAYSSGTTPSGQLEGAVGPTVIEHVLLSELKAGTTYHYRIIATNESGTTHGPDATFTTGKPQPPAAFTGEANSITGTSATITAGVNPDGLPTSYTFEVGSEAEPGVISYTPTYGTAGDGSAGVGLSLGLTGLQPGTTYHYRITAHNEDGTVTGADQTFTTSGFTPSITAPASVALIPFTAPVEAPAGKGVTVKSLTRAQKLTKALKQCSKQPKHKRAACIKTARKHYGPVKSKSAKRSKRSEEADCKKCEIGSGSRRPRAAS